MLTIVLNLWRGTFLLYCSLRVYLLGMIVLLSPGHFFKNYVLVYLLAAFFIRPFYKMMLGKTISLIDMESVVRRSTLSLRHMFTTAELGKVTND